MGKVKATGLACRHRDLGLPLFSVQRLEGDE